MNLLSKFMDKIVRQPQISGIFLQKILHKKLFKKPKIKYDKINVIYDYINKNERGQMDGVWAKESSTYESCFRTKGS